MKLHSVQDKVIAVVKPLNAELNSICHFLALLVAHLILHVSRIRVKPSKNVARSELFGNDSHISELYTMKTEAAGCSETTVPIYGTPAMHPHTCSRIRNLQSGITASRLAM